MKNFMDHIEDFYDQHCELIVGLSVLLTVMIMMFECSEYRDTFGVLGGLYAYRRTIIVAAAAFVPQVVIMHRESREINEMLRNKN